MRFGPNRTNHAVLSALCCACLLTLLHSCALADADDHTTKLPIPDAKAQREAAELVAEIYSPAGIRTPEARAAMAKEMLQFAIESASEPAHRYVLLQQASEIALQAGDWQTAYEAVDHLDATFEIDALKLKVDMLPMATRGRRPATERRQLATLIDAMVEEALAQDQYALATPLAEQALEQAGMANDAAVVTRGVTRLQQARGAEAAYARARPAFETLKTSPDDPEASVAAGRFLCFVKGDWDQGLPLLARADDPQLKDLADAEIAGAHSAYEQVRIGDEWWFWAEEAESFEGTQARLRAAMWYRQALQDLEEGLVRRRTELRLNSIASVQTEERLLSADATYRPSSNDQRFPIPLPAFLEPTDEQMYQFNRRLSDKSGEFSFHTDVEQGAHVLIDLGRRATLSRVIIENRRIHPDRVGRSRQLQAEASGLMLWISSDNRRFEHVWTAETAEPKWEVDLAERSLKARYLRIGFPDNESERWLALAKVMVFGWDD